MTISRFYSRPKTLPSPSETLVFFVYACVRSCVRVRACVCHVRVSVSVYGRACVRVVRA